MKSFVALLALAALAALSASLPIRISVTRISSNLSILPLHFLPAKEVSLLDLAPLAEDDFEGELDNRPFTPSSTLPVSQALEIARPLATEYLMSLSKEQTGAEEPETDEEVPYRHLHECAEHLQKASDAVAGWWSVVDLSGRFLVAVIGAFLFVELVCLLLQRPSWSNNGGMRLQEEEEPEKPLSLQADEVSLTEKA